jgi:GT2 family glycosyltransferase
MADVTVVIPTRDRWDVLSRTLAGLERQELRGVDAEVVVVDNGSHERPELPGVRVVSEPVPGAAAARNRGIAEARGRIVLFIGDDCIPADDGLVRGHVESHTGGAPRAVTGRIEWDPGLERTEAMDWLERSGHIVNMERLRREEPGPETFYTGNVSAPRQALLEAAGFDQRFSGYGYEDLELALRLADRGVRFAHRPDLGVLHSHRYGIERSLDRMVAVGRGGRLLHAIHDHRRPRPGPPAGRRRLAAGLALGRVAALRREPPRALPLVARDVWMRAAHLGAFARGYVSEPLDDHPSLRGYGAVPRWSDEPRPPVSVVVPFLGTAAEARALMAALAQLRVLEGDELVVVDNGGTLGGAGPARDPGAAPPGLRVVPAREERSSYYARNAGADAAANDWLLFLDADTRPPAALLDDYFREPVGERRGALAGGVVAARAQRSLVARFAASRRYLSQAAHLRDAHRPYAITANLLVRRRAWAEVGGFLEGLRSGGDQDLCWRIQDEGWTLEYREPAAVEHLHRERVGPLLRQMARYSAAIAWMERRAPGSSPRPRVTGRLVRSALVALAWAAGGRSERAAFKLLDGAVVLAEGAGYVMSNDAPSGSAPTRPTAALVLDEFPTPETGALAESLAERGPLVIEAARRPQRPDREAAKRLRARGVRVRFAEDDGTARRLAAALRMGFRARGIAAPAQRLRKAAVAELHSDPASEDRAAALASVLGVAVAGAREVDAVSATPAGARP